MGYCRVARSISDREFELHKHIWILCTDMCNLLHLNAGFCEIVIQNNSSIKGLVNISIF